jgi:trigger factor
MQVTKSKQTKLSVELAVKADEKELLDIKRQVLGRLRPHVSSKGFRAGKAPDAIVEKELGAETVQKEFLDDALSQLFRRAIEQEKLTTIGQPTLNVQKFVPYSTLEFTLELELRPPVTLPDLKSLKVTAEQETVTDGRIEEVLDNLRRRAAERVAVKRAAQESDELTIDFDGKDAKGNEVAGAKGMDMPVQIGSDTFIPGFETELVGLKKGDKKTFTLTFPKDYHARALQSAKVTFEVTVKEVREVKLPTLDDEFAAKASPFDTLKDLRADIAQQLETEYAKQAEKARREALVGQLLDKTKLEIPPKFLSQVVEEVRQDFLRSLAERGLDEETFYTREKTDKDTYETKELRPVAERRVKGSLILSEVARAEEVSVGREELEAYVAYLREQYAKDEKALEQLDKPEVREDIAMQMLTERTIDRLVELASSTNSSK